MYNLKKQAQIKPTEKMLQDQNEHYDVSQKGNAVITNKMLADNRKNPQGDKIGEKQLKEVRNATDSVISEKQLNKGTGSAVDTRGDDGVVLMDMPIEENRKFQADFTKENKGTDANRAFWDAYVDIGAKKIVNNVQDSQFITNYDSREEFNKKNPSLGKKAMSLLQDADAMLYHIYKQASSQNRELTEDEQLMVNNINANKMNIIAQIHSGPISDIAVQEEYGADKFDIEAEDKEQQKEEYESFLKYQRDHPEEFV